MQFLLERFASSHWPSKKELDNPDISSAFAAQKTALTELKAAIAAQITRIVSARVLDTEGELSLLEFGMPNVVELGTHNKGQLERYGARLARLISHYEPRLISPSVQVVATKNPLMPYRLVVSGSLTSATAAERFYFDLPTH